ncbi:MAG: hypothetical protein ABJA82_09535 [Myxococcales bacterium]
MTSAIAGLLLATLAVSPVPPAGSPPDPAPARWRVSEWAGVELTPAWLNVNGTPDFGDFGGEAPKAHSEGVAATLRLFRLRSGRTYIVPVELSVGAGLGGAEGGFGQLAAEFGADLGPSLPLEIGASLGLGLVALQYSTHCDGACLVGGGPLVFSPVARFGLIRSRSVDLSLFLRAVVPLGDVGVFGWNHGFAMPVLFGLDIAAPRR